MKLKEILLVPLQPRRGNLFKHFDLQAGKQVTTAENNPVWFYTLAPNHELYAVKVEGTDEIAAYLFGVKWTFQGKEYLVVKDAQTIPKYQRMGFMTALYDAVRTELNVSLISDEEQSPPMQQVWKYATKVLDTKQQRFLPRNKVPEDELYTTSKDIDPETEKPKAYRYRLVMEHPVPDTLGLPSLPKGVLRDRVIYTHYENKGKYE